MNNEEKILAMLEQLQQGQTETNARLDGLDQRMGAMESRLETIDTNVCETRYAVEGLQERVKRIWIHLVGHHGKITMIEDNLQEG